MTNDEFLQFMQKEFDKLMKLQKIKSSEYTINNFDENFEIASKLLNASKEQTALYYMTKHIVSIYDIILNKRNYDKLDEKINDTIMYLLMINALVKMKKD
jgi:hypothetical protein